MAGVKPVEYIKDSSTAGFAVAGDQKPITDNNANTIKKDVDQGNTEKLDNGQTKLLESKVDEDTIDYSNEEMKNVGKNYINTEGTENKDNGIVASATTGAGIAAAATAGAIVQSTTVSTSMTLNVGAIGNIPAKQVQVQVNTVKAADGFTQLLMSGILLASGIASAVLAFLLDPTLSEKKNQTNASEDTNQTIQNYFDLMTSDMDTMVEDAEKYKDLSDSKLASDIERMTQIGVLQGQIASLKEQGNLEKVAELQAQLDELTQEGEEDPTGAMLGDLEKGLETYSANSAEASGVLESGQTVAEFLQQGNKLKVLAAINSTLLGLCGLYCISAVVGMFPKLAPFFPDLGGNLAAKIMMGAAGAAFAVASYQMGATAKAEGDAGDAGNKMQEYVDNLRSNVEQQTGFTETTGAGYTAITTENAETTKKVQDGINKANKNNPTQPTGNNPTTPTNGNGNGDGNGNGEKPKEPTAPEGAVA